MDIVEQGFDAGIRLIEAVPKDMVAVKFGGDVRFIAVAAPSYLEGKARPQTPEDLHAHSCLRQRLPSGKRYRWEFSRHGAEIAIDVPGKLTLDDNDFLWRRRRPGADLPMSRNTSPTAFDLRSIGDGA